VARMWSKYVSLMLAIALIVTIAPWSKPDKAAAADAPEFVLEGVGPEGDPKLVSAPIMELTGTYAGIAGDSITYDVVRIVGTTEYEVTKGEKPIITGGTRFTFSGVQLAEGLNKITVSGNSSSNTGKASKSGYVFYGNEPIITSIQLVDGRTIPDGGEPLVTGPVQPVILLTAKNTTSVTVNGRAAFPGGGDIFSAENLGLTQGLNTLKIVAHNAGKTYEITRQLIYFNGKSTIYDLRVGSTAIDGNPITGLPGAVISGKIALELPGGGPDPATPDVNITLVNSNGNVISGPLTATLQTSPPPIKQGNLIVYNFTTAGSVANVTANGDYGLVIEDNWRGATTKSTVNFKIRDTSKAYIAGIKVLKGVTVSATNEVTFTGSEDYSVNQMLNIPSLPMYIHVDSVADASATFTTDIESFLEGSTVASAALSFDELTYQGERVYRIKTLPQGKQTLRFTIVEGTSKDSVSRTAEFLPIPAIRVTNVADNQRFTNKEALNTLDLKGQLVNFNPAEYVSLKMVFNGQESSVNATPPGTFTIDPATGIFTVADGLTLVDGTNVLTFKATTNGVPITTTLTLYYFTTDIPSIAYINPVRDNRPDINSTKDDLFIASEDGRSYTTTEEKVDVLFEISNGETVLVKVDGTVTATGTVASPYTTDNTSLSSADGLKWRFKSNLPTTGTRSYSITVVKGTASIERIITITRENPKYQVLSPRLPKEKLVNQNFLNISIQAPGAVRVVVGKQEMKQSTTNADIFRLTYTGLKTGSNKIKFTVYQSADGKTKFDDTIEVTYAGDSSVGAQSRLALSNKMKAFNGGLSLSFPKNTYLQQIKNTNPNIPDNSTDLFEDQEILVGIADPSDGRTVKTYNVDGEIVQIGQDVPMRSRLTPPSHYLAVSDLYWIDAGYKTLVGGVNGEYESYKAEHPYMYQINSTDYQPFMSRVNDKTKWLEPSQRGEITIKFDSQLRSVTASNVSVWRLNGLVWENIGGIVDVNNKTVTAPFDGFGYYTVMSLNYSYNDIVSHGYGRDSMELLLARGVMKAKDPSEFGAYDRITRGEFAQMLVKMANIELDYDPDVNKLTFSDVPMADVSGLWDYRYIETAARKGIVRGKTPRLFGPNDPLTREQAAVMIARALNLMKGKEDADKDKVALQKAFTDANLIEDVNSYSPIQAVVKAGFIAGIPNTASGGEKPTYRFDPRANLLRGDAAVIAVRVMKKGKLI